MPKPKIPWKPFTPLDRHKMTSYDMNVTNYSGSKEAEQINLRTQKRMDRQDRFFKQMLGRGRYDPDPEPKGWELHPKIKKYYQLKSESERRAYLRESERLKAKLWPTQKQVEVAKEKAEVILQEQNNVIRLDNLARMLTELSLEAPFETNEIARGQKGVLKLRSAPKQITTYFIRGFATEVAQGGNFAKYNAVAYFKPVPLSYENGGHMGFKWGRLKEDHKLYAVQVMHWDPKVLAGFTKGMLKKRPNDPIAVFDLYGNRFFP